MLWLLGNALYNTFRSGLEWTRNEGGLLIARTREAGRATRLSEDRRMWRLLLARLHPDAGGDHELFVFACALKEEMYGAGHPGREPFLRAWQEEMNCWALRNREALRNSWAYSGGKPEA